MVHSREIVSSHTHLNAVNWVGEAGEAKYMGSVNITAPIEKSLLKSSLDNLLETSVLGTIKPHLFKAVSVRVMDQRMEGGTPYKPALSQRGSQDSFFFLFYFISTSENQHLELVMQTDTRSRMIWSKTVSEVLCSDAYSNEPHNRTGCQALRSVQ